MRFYNQRLGRDFGAYIILDLEIDILKAREQKRGKQGLFYIETFDRDNPYPNLFDLYIPAAHILASGGTSNISGRL